MRRPVRRDVGRAIAWECEGYGRLRGTIVAVRNGVAKVEYRIERINPVGERFTAYFSPTDCPKGVVIGEAS